MNDAQQDGTAAAETLAARWAAVRLRLERACARAGRDPAEARVVAVSKTHPPEAVVEAAACGLTVFGESRVQEAAQKIPHCPGGLEWHLVGHLQRNKVRAAVECFSLVHSVDSWRLLEALEQACDAAGRDLPVLLEVNVSGEAVKYGFTPDAVPAILERCTALPHLSVCGLMTVPPFAPDPEAARPHFRRLRACRDRWRDATGFALEELSMGMSNDFEVAVEEGATLVRIGSALFGRRGGKP